MKRLLVLCLIFVASLTGGRVDAQDGPLPTPTGAVLLTISGNIARTNGVDQTGRPVARFDRAMLEALAPKTVTTATLWHEGVSRFEGPSSAALMAAVKGTGKAARAIALNEYVVDLPMEDFVGDKFVLAMKVNGKELTIRDRGPIFVIYDYDRTPKNSLNVVQNRSIWQLIRLEVK
jgi:hypothetical protein